MNRFILQNLLLLFLLGTFFSCKQKKVIKSTGFIERSIELQDSAGKVTIQLPARLDKYHFWKDDDKDINNTRAYYRLNDDNYLFAKDKIQEHRSKELDSIYQFTIWQNIVPDKNYKPYPCFDRCDSLDVSERGGCVTDDHNTYMLNEIKFINKRPFSILAGITKGYWKVDFKRTRFVIAKTCLNNRQLIFYAECRGVDTVGFLDKFYKAINSVKIIEYKLVRPV
ncbi:MAG: hypothetical protein WDO71_10340 [Bacteroidota bacterium]